MKYIAASSLIAGLIGTGVAYDTGRLKIAALEETYQITYNSNVISKSKVSKKLEKSLLLADENDTVIIDLTTLGGSVLEMMRILDLMKLCKGKVVVRVSGFSMSAGTLIMFAADKVIIGGDSLLLFHLSSRYGKVSPLDHPIQQHVMRMMDKYLVKYLTPREIRKIISGADVLVPGSELNKRIKAGKDVNEGVTFLDEADKRLGR